MGKSQKKRQMRRHNPMRVPDSHLPKGLASASASSSKTEAILPIIQKLEGPDAAERKWACVAVSNLIQNDPSTRRLLQGKNVVGVLITRLSDSEEEVVIEAAGSLRNLCVDGGYDICAEMYNKNILIPLKTFVPKISASLSQILESPKTAPENAQKLVYEFADNVITILWCLSETSNKALNAINQIPLIPFLMSFLASRNKLPITTVTSAAQCLYVLSDDNTPTVEELRSNAAYTACLLSVVQTQVESNANGKSKALSDDREIALQVLCSGILRNISPIPPPSVAATVDLDRDIVLPTLQPVLSSISLQEAAQQVHELLVKLESEDAVPQIEKLSLKNAPRPDHKTPSERELEQLEAKLRTVQLALEILTGVCAKLPDSESNLEVNEDGQEGGHGDEDMEDEDMADESDVIVDQAEDSSLSHTYLPTLVAPLLALIHSTPLSYPPPDGPSPHPPTTSALSAIHVCAFECLNNIFLSLRGVSLPPADGQRVCSEIWTALGAVGIDLVGGAGQERRREMWEVGIGALWGAANVWRGMIVPEEEQVQILVQLCDAAVDPRMKVKCIGTLECLAQHPHSIDANRSIATYLLSLLPSSTRPLIPTEPLLQAVSALIDIYSDETLPYDQNFREGHYIEALIASVEGVRKAVRGIDRKKEKDMRRRGEDIRDNLVAFIEYRRSLGL